MVILHCIEATFYDEEIYKFNRDGDGDHHLFAIRV